MNGGRPESGSSFSIGWLFLPRRKREALSAVYGFCRFIDDIVDEGPASREERAKELEFWRGEIDRLFEGNPTHAVSRALLPHVREFRLPKEGFAELVNGCAMDLERSRYETFAELEKYLFGVAGAVGLLCVEIFGYQYTPSADVRAYAVSMGNAFQLTNILRDVGADLEKGRVYIPLEDMRAAGCSLESFLSRRHSPEFHRLMSAQYERAKAYYRRARNLIAAPDRPSMVPAEAMASVYEAVLDELKARQFHVFFERVSIPPWRKLALALGAWLRCHGLY